AVVEEAEAGGGVELDGPAAHRRGLAAEQPEFAVDAHEVGADGAGAAAGDGQDLAIRPRSRVGVGRRPVRRRGAVTEIPTVGERPRAPSRLRAEGDGGGRDRLPGIGYAGEPDVGIETDADGAGGDRLVPGRDLESHVEAAPAQ